jgi:hypothetical protein
MDSCVVTAQEWQLASYAIASESADVIPRNTWMMRAAIWLRCHAWARRVATIFHVGSPLVAVQRARA